MRRSELELIKERLEMLQARENACEHFWSKPFQDTMYEEIVEKKEVRNGSPVMWHVRTIHTGEYKEVECFAQECLKCGKINRSTNIDDMIIIDTKGIKIR